MAIDLKKVLSTYKTDHQFVIKIATDDINQFDFSSFDTIMKVKGMVNRTKPQALPLASAPTDFPKLKGYFGNIYKMNISFEYPITENQIKNELSTALCLDRAFIIVRTEKSPLEEYDNNYLDYNEDEYIPVLLNDDKLDDINPDEFYGDKYNDELVKTLQSKEAQKYQQHFEEVDLEKHTNTGK